MENNTNRTIAIIAAIGSSANNPNTHGIYSADGKLPWPKLAKDMAFFKEKTVGHVTIMGRETWDSIGKPLPNRMNIVVTSSLSEGIHFWNDDKEMPYFARNSVKRALACAEEEKPFANIFFIGGKQLWQEAMPLCTSLFVTHVYNNSPQEKHSVIKTFPHLLEPEFFLSQFDFRLVECKSVIEGTFRLTFAEHRKGHPVYMQ